MTNVEVATRESRSQMPWLLIAAPGIAVALLGLAVIGYEALYLGLFAGADTVASYHFGSEAMVGAGGWAYASRRVYVVSSAALAAAAAILAMTISHGARRHHVRWLVAGYLGLALWLATVWYPS